MSRKGLEGKFYIENQFIFLLEYYLLYFFYLFPPDQTKENKIYFSLCLLYSEYDMFKNVYCLEKKSPILD